MIPINGVLDTYLNMNILLALVFGLWCLSRLALRMIGMRHAYVTQLRLLNGLFLAVALSPVFALLFALVPKTGLVPPNFSLNLADIVVAQYLQGRFQMNASELEAYLGMRQTFTSDLVNLGSTTSMVIAGFMAVGVVLFAGRLFVSIRRLRGIIRNSFAWRRFGNLHLRLSDTSRVPFSTRSLTRRYVVIPSSMLADGQDLRIALGHELQHLRQYDIEWEIVLELLKPVFFWNPVYYLWKRQVENLRELSCDQQVLARRHYDIEAYCGCLLRVCQNSMRTDHVFSVTMPRVALVKQERSLFGNSPVAILRRRFDSLLDGPNEDGRQQVMVFLMVPLLAMVAIASVAIQKPNDWSHDRLMLSTIVNLERLEVRNTMATPPAW